MSYFKLYSKQKSDLSELLREALRSNGVYNFSCGGCTVSYISKYYTHMKVRVLGHQGVLLRIGKSVKKALLTLVWVHMLICDHQVDRKDFKVLGSYFKKLISEMKESLFIKRDKAIFYKNKFFQELLLF